MRAKPNHPLLVALKNRKKSEKPMELPPPPRIFEIKHDELPELRGRKPGEALRLRLQGRIHANHDDGRTAIEVHLVQNEPSEENHGQEKEKSQTQEIVTTQESHA